MALKNKSRLQWSSKLTEATVCALIFASTLLIFWYSPVHQVSDSRYSMLLSQCLIDHKSFALDYYNLPRLEPVQREDYVMSGEIYQLEIVRGRVYYFFPPGSSVLSVPYVAVANTLGLSAANSDGTYNHQGEIAVETGLAAILMAILAAIFFRTARLLLPPSWSVLMALGGSLGTQIWSTASRGLWSHTWGVLLLGIVIYLLLIQETGKHKRHPVLLATLLAWMYFVRPSNSVFILAVSVYIFLYCRRLILPYAITGASWLAGFVFYSWHNFGHLLPSYYRANRLRFDVFHIALPGNLISPARGLLVYVPALIFVTLLLARFWKNRPLPHLAWLALFVSIGNLVVISGFSHWWGGASFGPRFSTDAVPWFVLLAIFGVRAMLNWRDQNKQQAAALSWSLQLLLGVVLLSLSIFINGRGAISIETWKWNEQPKDIRLMQKKLWDWRQPQFLAGLIRPPLDRVYPLVQGQTHIDFTRQEADNYLWYGWSGAEPDFRWTEAKEAALVFALSNVDDLTLRIKLIPFLYRGLRDEQRLTLELNGKSIESIALGEVKAYELSFTLPKSILADKNVLTLKLPDAQSPEALNISVDQRPLGIAVQWIEFKPKAVESGK